MAMPLDQNALHRVGILRVKGLVQVYYSDYLGFELTPLAFTACTERENDHLHIFYSKDTRTQPQLCTATIVKEQNIHAHVLFMLN